MKIAGRERIFFIGGACLLGALLLFQFAVDPALKRSRNLSRLILQKEKDLREIGPMRRELESLKELRAGLIQRIPAGERALAPLAKLDGLIERSGLRRNVRSIKPYPASPGGMEMMTVEVILEKADLPQLTRFLFQAQSSPGGFAISRLTVKPRYTTPRDLDVALQMVFYAG